MRVFDSHVHVGTWKSSGFQGCSTTLAKTADLYKQAGLDGFLAMPTDSADNLDVLAQYAGLQKPPSIRLAFWARPDDQANLAQFEATLPSWSALKIHPSFERIQVSDSRFGPYLEIACQHHLPVVVHCGRWQEMSGYGLALEVAAKRKELKVVLAHMGGDSPDLVRNAVDQTLSHKLDNVWFGTESIREYWMLQWAVSRLGSGRLVFGSDHNLNRPEPFLLGIRLLGLTSEQEEDILVRNAKYLFNL